MSKIAHELNRLFAAKCRSMGKFGLTRRENPLDVLQHICFHLLTYNNSVLNIFEKWLSAPQNKEMRFV